MNRRPLESARSRAAHPAHWLGIPNGALQPVATPPVADGGLGASADSARFADRWRAPDAPPRGWWRTALRLVRDAAIGLTLISTIPLWHVARRGEPYSLRPNLLAERLQEVEPLRVFGLPRDGTLTAQQAGSAYHALERVNGSPGFSVLPVATPLRRGWQRLQHDDPRFAALRHTASALPDPRRIVEVASRGLSDGELAYLRSIAESPVWAALEPVVRAPAVDFLGARVRLPFGPNASPLGMPRARYSDARELADAGVARAAYHVAMGDHARAEAALRLVVSYGFTLIDEGSDTFDGIVGRVVVTIGSYGLGDLQRVTGDAAGLALTTPAPRPPPLTRPTGERFTAAQATAYLLSIARDPTRPRTLRLDALQELSLGTCRSVRGVLFGHARAVDQAFDEAERSLVRVPADAAYLALLRDAPNRPLPPSGLRWTSTFVPGAARVATLLSGNPRFETCSGLDPEFR